MAELMLGYFYIFVSRLLFLSFATFSSLPKGWPP
jgi:hypothetical protein